MAGEKGFWVKAAISQVSLFILIAVMLFAAAGRVDYWQGWLYIIVMVFISIASLAIFSKKPALIKERIKPGPGTKWWDKIFMTLFLPLTMAIVLVSAMDAGRFNWTGKLPVFLYILSCAGCITGICIVIWAMRTNDFFSSAVRIQTDRGHKVVDSGPYALVRHPGYLGAISFTIAMPLVLGSARALILSMIVAILFIIRTILEDTTLQNELPGYSDYAKRVKYKLLPGIW